MPLYEYECEPCGHRFEKIQKFSDPPVDTCPKCGGAVHKLMSSPAIQFKGTRLVHHRLREEGPGARRESDGEDGKTKAAKAKAGSDVEGEQAGEDRSKRETQRAPSGKAPRRRPDAGRSPSAQPKAVPAGVPAAFERRQVLGELVGEVGPLQREVDHRLQEAELVAGVVADALHLARVNRPRLQQLAQAVGQLDLAGAIALRRRERRERCRASARSGR